ncbi:hypothetical protein I553_2549 [Mycobacterium xenopi 4042]|uniref:Uncharacterized protein n=1 Tax=Mycobacterium xenopi 4042 TaxID=1299334 RepID=X8C7N5_MYCXE|nr:hypothetical protein I552_6877 [Mycobacterium xenopi 3993]EUA52362.1 hypothetical protein I553_2549 [Mycobacterium xenopi 4042]
MAISNAVRPNRLPTNTISADMPTSSANVFTLLACGCQVISSSYEDRSC